MEPNPCETTKFKYRLESEHAEKPPNSAIIQKVKLDAIEYYLRMIFGVRSIRRTKINNSAAADLGMVGVRVEIVRCADDSYPASFECRLTDADGRLWSFVGKVPIVTAARLHAASLFPQPGVIACEVSGRDAV